VIDVSTGVDGDTEEKEDDLRRGEESAPNSSPEPLQCLLSALNVQAC
jgi:hypothetical protein